MRKTDVTTVLGISISLLMSVRIIFIMISGRSLAIAGIMLSSYTLDLNVAFTTFISGPLEFVKRHTPGIVEIVNVNIKNEPTNKIKMRQNRYECLLPKQRLTNSKCRLTTTGIIKILNDIKRIYLLLTRNLSSS